MQHVMVDLETMGKRAGCAVVSIGAVKFDPAKDPNGSEISLPKNRFYKVIDLNTCLKSGLKISADTLYWWMGQKEQARSALLVHDKYPLRETCEKFSEWFEGSQFIWGHGASFDQPILEAAYAAARVKLPYTYGNIRDTRTIFDITGAWPQRSADTHHHALADAEDQAVAVLAAYRILGEK